MQKTFLFSLALFSLLISSCLPGTVQVSTPEVVSVYASYAAEPWLYKVYDCAGTASVISRVDDPSSAAIVLRVGEPEILASFAYQIDVEEILVVTHRQSPLNNTNIDEVQALFAGQGDPSVQVWVYASGEDVQEVFDQFVMEGRSVTSSANIAATPEQMSTLLINEANTVGVLPKHWKTGDSRFIYTLPNIPVLAITHSEPQGTIKELIACLQK
jgi:hypothetical protein